MGLLYPFPIQAEESGDHVTLDESGLTLKSYGLPYIFWGYLLAALTTIGLMVLAMGNALERMLSSGDEINALLAALTLATLVGTPLGLTALFFVEYRIFKKGRTLTKSLYFLGLPLRRRRFRLRESTPFEIENFSGTPNIARMKGRPEDRPHQNRGYYQLFLYTERGERILLDRHSLGSELSKLQQLLESC